MKPELAQEPAIEIERHEGGVVLEVRRVNDPRRLRRLVRLLADLALAEPLDKPDESGGTSK